MMATRTRYVRSFQAVRTPVILVSSLLLIACTPAVDDESSRWYSQAQVEQGAVIFQQNCAVCHGDKAQSIPDWKTVDENGNYPAPPLDGSAHTWHHDLSILRKTIKDGGVALGGTMPPFKDKLGIEQQDAVIAYFQDIWPDEIYAKWSSRFLKND